MKSTVNNHHIKFIRNSLNEFFIYSGSFCIPVLILLFIFAKLQLFPFGSNSFLINDMKWQYADMLGYQNFIFTGKENIFYTFSRNLGGDMFSTYAYYLANPINLLVLFFGQADLPKAIPLIMLLKIGLSGLTNSIYLCKTIARKPTVLIFSSAYALMAYTLSNIENFQFLDAVILLPLIALGIEKIMMKSSPVLFIVSLFVAICNNFYIGWMLCIFSFLFFIFKYLLNVDTTKKSSLHVFILSSVISVGLSAFILIPTTFQLSESIKSFDPSFFSLSFNFSPYKILSKFYTSAFDVNEIRSAGLPGIFCGILPSILFFLFFFNKKISKKEKNLTFLFSFFILFSFLLTPLDLFWHGFHSPQWWPYRYSFVFSFLIVTTGFRSLALIKKDAIKPFYLLLCVLLSMFISAIFLILEHFKRFSVEYLDYKNLLGDILLTILLCLLLSHKIGAIRLFDKKFSNRISSYVLLILSCANLAANAFTYIQIKTENQQPLHIYHDYVSTLGPVISQIQQNDPDFYRIEKLFYRSYNDSMQFNYNGISHFNSFVNPEILNLLKKLGYASDRNVTSYSYGSTVFSDSILGIKYLLSFDSEINKPYSKNFEKDGIKVFENPYVLPLGFLVSDSILDFQMSDQNLFEIQNSLFSHMIDKKTQTLFTNAETSETTIHNLLYQINGENIGLSLIDPTQEGSHSLENSHNAIESDLLSLSIND
ncbi:MAG: YfhO family protein [Flexilinea sp.]